MNVIHLSAECYPVAKVGGLGDVVGALPKYQNNLGIKAAVVMPYYDKKFTQENTFDTVYKGLVNLGSLQFEFEVLKESADKLGFPLFLIRIPGLLDRPEVYSYQDETEQFVTFQLAFLNWASQLDEKPDVVHCHDHHTGLIPFLMYYSASFKSLAGIPTVCTIHNGQYQGWMSWDKFYYLPDIDPWKTGLLDWNGAINPLASSVKCSWKYTTVSPSYLSELTVNSNGLEALFEMEKEKGVGIINGIDTAVWNPETDPMLVSTYNLNTAKKGKQENKRWLCKEFGFTLGKPLISFIGRLVGEKGADLLPEILTQCLTSLKGKVNFLILGSGDPVLEEQLTALKTDFKKSLNCFIGYNEELSHKIYAGSDFLLMPSRVEPCGLNQLYSLRYGTVPIVRSTGGLKDTVIDFEEEEGYGICFDNADTHSACQAIERAVNLYSNTALLQLLRKRMMALDYSWDKSANQYINLYNSLTSTNEL
ncbi:glycogen synthase [Rubrolithibacter danxiaensis]|uniref:glycogen synthase n=1 Tax=Rubrolithibacter danxiaensis TaxID=3390805 RepID=UPI003BF78EB4